MCVCIKSFNKPRGPGEQRTVGIQVHAGSWVGQSERTDSQKQGGELEKCVSA